ncbi:Xaa-Pro aminopeptidase [Hoeflea phototrophica DFL-43]|uniref:Xaa-Pro aminopeptidase n=1 Tax=Hoeflea phototrophica (strain DSM 17068 / NCIMB 14078 / DFL-43) TaxID=411684 RepID=A9DBN4_HOEPD|nr:Xaa-Pro peptidase family protein [Hoeflea phototrophica]EDQ32563.2 Xaa-Pro aminopeptidase [Hoeflea phototrophica DFL-43]
MSLDPHHPKAEAGPGRGFPVSEFESRLARAQSAMADLGVDGLFLTTEPEIRYFTGFLSRFWLSPTRPWFLLVPATGKPVAVVPSIGRECFDATWLDDVRSWESPRPEDEGVSLLASTIGEVLGHNARIGVPQGPETHLRMPVGDFHRLRDMLRGCEFVDASGLISSLRMIKSAAEIEKIAHACTMVSDVFEAFPDQLRMGMSEIEIFRRFKIACLERGIDDVDYLVGGAGPGGYMDIISPPSPRGARAGDILMLDTGAVFDGYFCDFDRNFAFGPVSSAAEKAYGVLLDAAQAGLEATRPGSTCAEIYHAMQRVLDKDFPGGSGVGRMGHGLGMQLTEWPSIMATDETPVQAGMVLTLEPSVDLGGGRMMVHEENLVLTEDGPVLLTRPAPKSLPLITV